MEEGKRVSVGVDNVLDVLRTALELVLSLFKPVVAAISKVAGASMAGFTIVFALFFTLMLLRWAAGSRNTQVFADGLLKIGRAGAMLCLLYLLMLALERTLIPLAVVGLSLAYNSATGAEPGFAQFAEALRQPAGSIFAQEFFKLVIGTKSILPLNFASSLLVTAAVLSMWLTGRALSKEGRHA